MGKIFVRTDGNEILATGHVMRCLSIAEALRKLGEEVVFVVADDRPRELITGRGFQMDVLDTIWNDLNQETEILCEYMKKNHVDVLLLDSYYVTKEYLQILSQYTKIIYIDDLKKFDYPVNTIIHYSPFAKEEEYRKLSKEDEKFPCILCGAEYIPLREEFAYQPYEVKEKVSKVLITTGGTDQLNVAGNLLNRLLENKALASLEYHVIIGCFHSDKEGLQKLAEKHPNIFVHENVRNMSDFMRHCDVAISAGGTTLYELCACGIPTICLEVADNQHGAVIWQQQDYMEYAGNAYMDMESCVKQCEKSLIKYMENRKMREQRSHRMQTLVDGSGAKRIAQYIVNMEG